MSSPSRAGAPTPSEPPATSARGPLAGARVLVVEDNVLVADVVCAVLRRAGAEICGPVATTDEGIAALEQRPHAALLDADLRGESSEPVALACCRAGVPFAVVTGFDAGVTRSWRCQGCVTLEKPLPTAQLVEVVAALLRGEWACRQPGAAEGGA